MNKLKKLFDKYIGGNIAKPDYIEEMHNMHSSLFEYSDFIKNKDISKIEITDDSVIMTSRNTAVKIICDSADYRIAPIEILNFTYYEKEDSGMMDELLELMSPEGAVIFDIGANIGWYSINFSKKLKQVDIYAFEPVPTTHDYLVTNCVMNGVKNVIREKKGLSDIEDELDIYYYPEGSGNSSLKNLTEDSNVQKFTADITTLDNYMDKNKIKSLDFIKCDVEGAELLVFKGGEKSIIKYKPIIFTEMLRKWSAKFDYHPNEIIEFFAGLGYECFVTKQGKLRKFFEMDDGTIETNFFFMHTVKHKKEIESLV